MTEYSLEIADEICDRMANGESLSSICRDPRMPSRKTVNQWISHNYGGMSDRYARARDLRAEYLADEIIEISDSVRKGATSEEVQAARLAADNRKWTASKLMPHRYGDKVEHTHGSDPDKPVVNVIKLVGVRADKKE